MYKKLKLQDEDELENDGISTTQRLDKYSNKC